MTDALRDLVAAELAQPVDPRVAAMAAAIAAKHGAASRAVLFYGSCLREKQLDGLMLDFYLIVSDYRAAYDKRWLARANALIPPNVFPFEHDGLAAKYAVLSEADFHRLNGPETRNVSVWARFAQPSRLVWAADDAARDAAIAAVARAAPTLLGGRRAASRAKTPLDWWRRAFALTYSAELRAERKGRSGSVVDADRDRYRALLRRRRSRRSSPARASGGWARRRIEGKAAVGRSASPRPARPTPAARITSRGRSTATPAPNRAQAVAAAQPLLAAISLLPRLLRSGAIR